MAVSSPKGTRQDILADSVEMNKSLESQDVAAPEKAQMETDDGEEQDSKMEIGSNNGKEEGQWSSGEESGVEGGGQDRSFPLYAKPRGGNRRRKFQSPERNKVSTPR